MKSLVIIVEFRPPKDKAEAALYGHCETEDKKVSRIFINSRREPDSRIDTFFHEMAHAFIHWRGGRSGRRGERIAAAVGSAAQAAFLEACK